MQMWLWRALPVTQKNDQPIWDVQTKLCKNAFLENKQKNKARKTMSLKTFKFWFEHNLSYMERIWISSKMVLRALSQTREATFQCLQHLSWPSGCLSPSPRALGGPLSKPSFSYWDWSRVYMNRKVNQGLSHSLWLSESTLSLGSGLAMICTMENLSDRKEEASPLAELVTAGAHVGAGRRSSNSSCEGSLARIWTHISCIQGECPMPVPISSWA